MPPRVDPNPNTAVTNFGSVDYQYDYGGLPDMRPGSPLHEKLLRLVMDGSAESWDTMKERHPEWDKVEDTCKAFIPLDAKEMKVKSKDSRRPTSIVVPLSYAVRETLLSHLMAIYMQDIIWQFDPRGPEDVLSTALMENLIDTQAKKFKHALSIHTFLKDGITNGLGIMAPIWETKYGLRDQIIQDPFTGQTIKEKQQVLLHEGNKLKNINPRLYLPDPNVPANEVQEGEFVSWIWRDSQIGILEEEYSGQGDIFNAKYLHHIADGRSKIFSDSRNDQTYSSQQNTRPIDRIFMYKKIIPAQVGLGPSEYPEIWAFQVAGDEVVISAKPLGLNHQMFPVAVCAPDYDGYGPTPIGRLEVTMGLQGVADFLYNSHVANVRKVLNDMVVVDPSVINMSDLTREGSGKIIRVRRNMFGQNAIDKGIKHIPVASVTGSHVNEVGVVDGIMSKVSGASESMQGVFAGGERRSAQESRDTFLSGVGRVEKMARIISEQAMGDLGFMLASHTQQFLSQDTYVRATGRNQEAIMVNLGIDPTTTRVPVGPSDLMDVNYDAIIRDGSMPSTSFIQEHIQLLDLATRDPQTYNQYDTARWMAEIARRMGVKNIDDFRLEVTTQSNSQVEAGMEEGNLEAI